MEKLVLDPVSSARWRAADDPANFLEACIAAGSKLGIRHKAEALARKAGGPVAIYSSDQILLTIVQP